MEPLLDVYEYEEGGIGGTAAFGAWQALLLNYLPRLAPKEVADMQRHTQTDEIFILLKGQAILFTAGGEDAPTGALLGTPLERGKLYRVPQNVWHTQVMTPDAKIALVENSDTVAENSPRHPITQQQRSQLMDFVESRWGKLW